MVVQHRQPESALVQELCLDIWQPKLIQVPDTQEHGILVTDPSCCMWAPVSWFGIMK